MINNMATQTFVGTGPERSYMVTAMQPITWQRSDSHSDVACNILTQYSPEPEPDQNTATVTARQPVTLSKLQLKTGDLDPRLFSRLRHLQNLDLSDNLLDKLPANLSLPDLRVLNCSNNQLEDVTVLKQFPLLEELNYENNVYLTTNDDYKVMFLLQNLRLLNGKDVTKLANHVRVVNSRELTSKVTAHWERHFRSQLPEKYSAEHVMFIRKKFLKSAQTHVIYGPSSLGEFTRWRVKMIAEELLASMQGQEENTHPETQERMEDDDEETTENPREVGEDDIAQAKVAEETHRNGEQPPKGQSHRRSSQLTEEQKSQDQDKRVLTITPVKNLEDKEVISLEPFHFLQCHSKGNSREDFKTQLWSCVFEPPLDSGTRKDPVVSTSRTMATCGGESVCLIDCETGIVLKKYKVPAEEFFTVAWTTLTMVTNDGRKKKHNILAAAGRRGIVKLIHVSADFCYGEIKAHKKPIATACFSPTCETHLFTASYDKRIGLWDIGVPDCDYNFKASQLMVLEVASIPLRIALVPSCPDQFLLAGCEEGCFAWDIRLDKPQKSRPFEVAFQFPNDEGEETASHRVDGLAFLNKDVVVSKSSKTGSIYLWSWSQSFEAQGKSCQRTRPALILAELEWSTTDLPYLTLSTCPAAEYVFCGDEKGSVWMYNLSKHSSAWRASKGKCSENRIAPTQILEWPELRANGELLTEVLINNVVTDPTFTYLIALTGVNIAAVWKKT
ncbi:Leucine-rich repeat and WD repeat-containing protein 1 [Chelonia mydas]|uniref:Leucine-rich repeat and WD repeat-containing protein 1 n=1 Tax=Chelonia mydas TaxID=8469 RepID=M7ATZ9_CHEMY|nr:Leucine-rich repeat and WD repeat-containing protein 1 [Chelonia mydas]